METSTHVLMRGSSCVGTVSAGELDTISKNIFILLLGCNVGVVFIRTQMGSSLYELDLELFEDIDSEVGNYLMVGALTDIFISTVLALLRGFSSEVSGFLPDTETDTSKFQLELKTVDKEPLCGMCHCKFLSILF